ncbi:uncharacterized protein VTP21DRAFT_357 [Calcarisporiella thermophila]|uniref:uncharacterized protein n=1 Tax=Calcarisporiella thermophila TaxID=911321 RepID=UPI003743E5BD
MMNQRPQRLLYGYFRSSCTWRVRIALGYKGLEYKTIYTSLIKGDEQSPEYAKINPCKRVPTLVDDNFTLTQSIAILEYLEEKYPEKPMLPKDLHARAQIRSLVNVIACDIFPFQNTGVLKHALIDPFRREWAQEWIIKGFTGLEDLLKKTSGKYCYGDEFTLADCVLVPQAFNAFVRYRVDASQFPTIKRVYENLLTIEAVHKAHPFQQPDCPPEFRELDSL